MSLMKKLLDFCKWIKEVKVLVNYLIVQSADTDIDGFVYSNLFLELHVSSQSSDNDSPIRRFLIGQLKETQIVKTNIFNISRFNLNDIKLTRLNKT